MDKVSKTLVKSRFLVLFTSKRFSIVILNSILPLLVFYSFRLLPTRDTAGITKYFFIVINPRFKNDYSVLTHEVTHVRQIFRTFFLHYFLYRFSAKYRYSSELEAYAYQVLYLIISSKVGLNGVLIDRLIEWITDVMANELEFKRTLGKDDAEIRADFTKKLVVLLKQHKKVIDDSELEL